MKRGYLVLGGIILLLVIVLIISGCAKAEGAEFTCDCCSTRCQDDGGTLGHTIEDGECLCHCMDNAEVENAGPAEDCTAPSLCNDENCEWWCLKWTGLESGAIRNSDNCDPEKTTGTGCMCGAPGDSGGDIFGGCCV